MTRAFFAGMGAAFAAMIGAMIGVAGSVYAARRFVAARKAQAWQEMATAARDAFARKVQDRD